jgi:hypothetical protein
MMAWALVLATDILAGEGDEAPKRRRRSEAMVGGLGVVCGSGVRSRSACESDVYMYGGMDGEVKRECSRY